MLSYTCKRLLLSIPTLFGITIVTFIIIHLMPGDPAQMRAGVGGNLSQTNAQKIIEETKKRYGLDAPLHEQYFRWLFRIVQLDFGNSFDDDRPVTAKILERLPISLQISLSSLILGYLISVPIGVFFSARQGSFWDQVVTVLMFILYSMPNFWVATMAIIFLCGGDFLHLFPVTGLESQFYGERSLWTTVLDRIWHLILPVACMTYGSLAYLSRYARAGMLEVIRQDFILTARAKGLKERVVIFRHGFRNALIPLLTLLGYLLPAMIAGSVIVETIFAIPGMGRLAYDAVIQRDYPTIMGFFSISALLTLLGFILSDILYAWARPRITFEGENT